MISVMTTNKALTAQDSYFSPSVPPVFVPAPEEVTQPQAQSNAAEISVFDVKELYDRAYDALNAGRDDYKAKEMMAQAIKMDMAYRCQLARKNTYQTRSQMHDFTITAQSV